MPDGDIFDNSLRRGWKKAFRAYLGRHSAEHKLACVSEAIRNTLSSGNTASAVGAAVAALETTLKNQQQGVLEFEHAPESPYRSFQSKLAKIVAEYGGGKSVGIVKEVTGAVFAQCQGTYVLEDTVNQMFAKELTRRLVAGQCLDLDVVKLKLAEEGVVTSANHEGWFEQEFEALYPSLRAEMEKYVASHGAKAPKKFLPVPAEAVNSSSYLTQPLSVFPLPDVQVK